VIGETANRGNGDAAGEGGDGMLAGRVVIVTGGGRGLGRAHALELARRGASVVVNDLDVAVDGSKLAGGDRSTSADVVAEIEAFAGIVLANHDDVADWEGSAHLIQATIDFFGRLNAVVNNAGVLRDRMFVNASAKEWDAVIRVHLRGHFCVARHAAAHWRDEAKNGRNVSGRIVNTSSGAGLLEIDGGRVTLMDGWQRAATIDSGRRLGVDEIGPLVDKLVCQSPEPLPAYGT
jgi:NAD(P)-dependent dehydrogenase (short-subunit alcohol dehydrogenase family)